MGKKESFSSRVGRAFGGEELSDVIMIYGNRRAVIRGCRKILSYEPDEIRILLGKRSVRVSGKDLRCVSFAVGSTTVEGRIRSVSFEENQKEGHS
ncbi:MAG: hypothetical protein E7680_06530 [Ruminococcaceae bacterium]|nr:hypothetical protein [Oscillospiraceae bacterium]